MYNRKDSYYRKAKKEGYRSRAAYKLIEINDKYKLLKKGMIVADIGCAPGGWSQVALDKVGSKGKVIGVDILTIKPLGNENYHFINGDFTSLEIMETIKETAGVPFDLVLSDISPNTTGIKVRDQALSLEICQLVFRFSLSVLKEGGDLLMKIFQSDDMKTLVSELRNSFEKVKIVKPKSSRKESGEVYLLAQKKK
ncbi:MAG: RlmE family RNA methyltransferase [Candidatus Schekmanbacteria bacterium]|nr:MAG: RlmE family RNA methyltransferase [Candidatus Schekmanbacteria bacterium]